MRIADSEVSRVTVIGFGRTGRAVTEFLLSRDIRPFVSDSARLSNDDHSFLATRKVPYEEDGHSKTALDTDLIILSPAVSPNLPLLSEAKRQETPILSELDLAYTVASAVPIIAVTGTNGKSTTVRLIEALLRQSGINAIVAGNIGTPFISVVGQTSACDAFVLEVSSFQLEQSTFFHPQIGVLLNLTPDHLDWHKTIAAYTNAKGRLFLNQTHEDTAILPTDLARNFPAIKAQRIFFDRLKLPPHSFIQRLFPHHRANLQAAIVACSAFLPQFDPTCIREKDIQKALDLPFRLRNEGTVGGVRVVNDSKSTNAASTLAALCSFKEPIVLILGGRHKQAGYEELAQAIAASSVRKVVVYGEAAAFLRETLNAAGCTRTEIYPNLEDATTAGLAAALPGDVLLFSPACASYDQFRDYLERGESFSRLIRSRPTFFQNHQRH